MKAGIYLGKEQIELRELPIPEVGDEDVLVENIYSSICGTDVSVYFHGPGTGHKVTVGGEFGHETVSRIVKVGKNVTDFTVGERVYPYPRFATGDMKRAGTIGGFSEYILIPNAKRNHSLYSVDERISDRLASLIEPFTVGCRAARRGMIPDGKNKYISGQTANIDCWLDAAGAENILDNFMQLGKIESRFVSVAVNNKPRNIDLLYMTYAQQSIIGSGGYMPEDVRDVQNIMTCGKWNLENIITHEFPLPELAQAIRTAGDVVRAGNVVIRMADAKEY